MLIRPARPADAPAIAAIHSASWREVYAPLLPEGALPPTLEEEHRALWDKVLAPSAGLRLVLVAEGGAELLGFLATHPDREDPALDYLAALHVAAPARSAGLGARLMAEAATRLDAIGRTGIWCHSLPANVRARAFYARLGGVEGAIEDVPLAGGHTVPDMRIELPPLPELAERARAAMARGEPPPRPPVIRAAIPADAEGIAAVHMASRRLAYRGLMADALLDPEGAGDRRPLWQAALAAPPPGQMILIAVPDEGGTDILGLVRTLPVAEAPGTEIVDRLYVRPDRQGEGLGTRLLLAAADRLIGLGRGRIVLDVLNENRSARAVYERLGATEIGPSPDDPDRQTRYAWDAEALALAARRRLARAAGGPLFAPGAPARVGNDHPTTSGPNASGRRKQALGDAFGLGDYGVNRVVVPPGGWSSIPHWHTAEDEFVHVLEGHLTLVLDGEEHGLGPGDCVGFPAGLARGHHLENRSAGPAVYLEVGSRRPDRDGCRYPGEDLRVDRRPDGSRGYVRGDGTPL